MPSTVERHSCRSEIESSDSDWDREKLEERLAKLSGGVAVIKVGAATETDLKKRKEAVEDAVSAAKAAVEEGIITGGGAALVQARSALKSLKDSLSGDEALGVDVFSQALSAPLYWIATNAGLDGAVVVNKVSELPAGQGFNAATLDVRRSRSRWCRRPGQGHPVGGSQRRVGGQDDSHHRDRDRGQARGAGGSRPWSQPRSWPLALSKRYETPPVLLGRGCFRLACHRYVAATASPY